MGNPIIYAGMKKVIVHIDLDEYIVGCLVITDTSIYPATFIKHRNILNITIPAKAIAKPCRFFVEIATSVDTWLTTEMISAVKGLIPYEKNTLTIYKSEIYPNNEDYWIIK